MRRHFLALFLFFSILLAGCLNIELVSSLQDSRSLSTHGTIIYESVPYLQVFRHGTGLTTEQFNDVNLLAQNLDMLTVWDYRGYQVSQLHQVNSDMKVLLYRNVRAIYSYADEWQMALDNGWMLRDSSGNLVYNPRYSNVHMVDHGNVEYQKWVANWIKERLDQYGFDGVFTDNGFNAVETAYWWDVGGETAQPINPRTGNLWTVDEVIDSLISLHHEIKLAIGSKLDIANGIFEGANFWKYQNNWKKLLADCEVDGFMSEGLFTKWEPYTYYSEEKWRQSVDFVAWVQNNWLNQPNQIYLPHARCSSDQIPVGSTSEQVANFVFASLLLGIEKSQNYLSLTEVTMLDKVQNLFKTDLGTPEGDYYLIEGTHVYARDFTKIKVLVNPTDQPYSVNLGEDYETLEGQIVSSVNIGTHTGLILKVIF